MGKKSRLKKERRGDKPFQPPNGNFIVSNHFPARFYSIGLAALLTGKIPEQIVNETT